LYYTFFSALWQAEQKTFSEKQKIAFDFVLTDVVFAVILAISTKNTVSMYARI